MNPALQKAASEILQIGMIDVDTMIDLTEAGYTIKDAEEVAYKDHIDFTFGGPNTR